ncbi:hypothetical protein SOL39_24110, partial [Klebsiella aerogenes]
LKLREYLLIKNCTLLRWVSNFLGAVQKGGFLLFCGLPRTVGLISTAPSGIQCPSFLPLTSAIGYSSLTQAFSSDVTYCIESHKNVKMHLRFSRPSL